MNMSMDILIPFHREGVKFIQVGANDGKRHDHLNKLICKFNWRGLLIEPVEESFAALLETYAAHDGLYFENVAIHPTDNNVTMYVPKHRKSRTCSSLIKEHAQMSGRKKPRRVKERDVAATTLDCLINKYGLEDVEWLHVDAEGYDFEVIKTISLDKYRPSIIYYEHKSLKEPRKCLRYLRSYDYEIFHVGESDTIVTRKS